MMQRLAIERALVDGHALVIDQRVNGKPKSTDAIVVSCTCGDELVFGVMSQYRRALALAERNHRRECGWHDVAAWHGTPSGYVNHCCRCDPCTWAWASYQRGDDPLDPAPVWLDDVLASMGTL